MSLAIATVVDAISKLSVSGVAIADMDAIPESTKMIGPALIPLPGFVTDFNMTRDSFGGGSTAKMTVTYTLNYRLLFCPIGGGRDLQYFDDMVTKVGLIWDAIVAIDTLSGSIDVIPNGMSNMGVVNDPSGGDYYGCDLALLVTEFVN